MSKYKHEFKRINELKKIDKDTYYIVPDYLYKQSTNIDLFNGNEDQVINTFKKLYSTIESEISFKNLTLLSNSVKLTLILKGDLETMRRLLTDANFGRITVLELSKIPADTIQKTKKQEELIYYFLNEYYGNYRYYQKTAEVRSFIDLIHVLFYRDNKLENVITFPYCADKISKKLYFTAIEDYLTNLLYKNNKDIKIHSYVEFYDLRRMIKLLNDNSLEIKETTTEGFKKINDEEEILDPFDKEFEAFIK